MFILRNVKIQDLDDLYELSKMVYFINLPADKQLLEDKIKCSLKSFHSPSQDFSRNHYLFVLEDTKSKKIIGASLIHAQHGTKNEPHYFLKVGQEKKFCQSITTGFIHGTLKFGYEIDGPTEIGGLILNPDYRGHREKLGKQLSYIRFLYIAIHASEFKEKIHSELMPPLDKDGNSPLWEAIGRHFLNMNYIEADILSRTNKEFILSLFPSETIYVPLLPLAARNVIGKVGPDTKPVKKMLEDIGFKYIYEIDPFDGGPHYQANLRDISPVKSLTQITFKEESNEELQAFSSDIKTLMVALKDDDENFIAATLLGKIVKKNKNISVIVNKNTLNSLNIKDGDQLNSILMEH